MHVSAFLKPIVVLSILLFSLSMTGAYPTAAQVTTCPNAPQTRLVVGRQAHVTPGSPNNLRSGPSKAAQIVVQVAGDTYVDVIGGPTCAQNMAWWQIKYGDQSGWMAEGSGSTYYVEPATSPILTVTLPEGQQTVDVNYGGVIMKYNGVFGSIVEATSVFAVKENPDMPMLPSGPAYTNYRFPTNKQNEYRQPSLSVYPAADYQKVNEFAGRQITALSALLKTEPLEPTDTIPTLPSVPAAQVFHSNVRYLSFGGGTGIRFITMFAQGLAPITNDQLWYLFQGLTADGKHFVTAWFPISASILAATYDDAKDFPDLNSPQASDLFTAYVKTTTERLNHTASGAFSPTLDDVDALLQSMNIQ